MSTTTRKTSAATGAGPALTAMSDPAAEAAVHAAAKTLQLPTIRDQAIPMAEAAAKQRLTHKAFLAEILTAECDERDARRRLRRVNEAKFPRTKRLANFDTARLPDLPAATLAHLAGGSWIDAGQPLVLLGDSGTGKTHLNRPGFSGESGVLPRRLSGKGSGQRSRSARAPAGWRRGTRSEGGAGCTSRPI